KTRFILAVPLLLRLIAAPVGQQRRGVDKIPNLIVWFGCHRQLELGRLLTVRMTAAAVVADFAWAKLVPGLGSVEQQAVLVERLEREGGVCGKFGEEAGIGIAIGIERLAF